MAAWARSVVGDQIQTEDGLEGREHLEFHCEAKRGDEGLYGKDAGKVVIVFHGDFSGNAVDNGTEGNTNPVHHFYKHESKEHQNSVRLDGRRRLDGRNNMVG